MIEGVTPVVLAGGLGTRLAGRLPGLPKVLAPVCGRPFADFVLSALALAGFSRAVISTGYMADQVRQTLGEARLGLGLKYVREDAPLGTGGGLRLAALLAVDTPWILAMNADSYVDLPLAAYLAAHEQSRWPASLVAVEVADVRRFGQIKADAQGRVCGFTEKGGPPRPGLVNAGIYLVRRAAVLALPQGPCSLETDLLPGLMGPGLFVHVAKAPFIDIGTPETFDQAQAFFALKAPKATP